MLWTSRVWNCHAYIFAAKVLCLFIHKRPLNVPPCHVLHTQPRQNYVSWKWWIFLHFVPLWLCQFNERSSVRRDVVTLSCWPSELTIIQKQRVHIIDDIFHSYKDRHKNWVFIGHYVKTNTYNKMNDSTVAAVLGKKTFVYFNIVSLTLMRKDVLF